MEGATLLALLKSSLTDRSDSPTYLLNNSAPFMDKKLNFDSCATALAIIVLQQPGGPYMRIPLTGFIPSRLKASGCVSGHVSVCCNASFICSPPPMSDHLVLGTCTLIALMALG